MGVLKAHREAIRSHHLLRESQIVFVCEKNMGFISGFMTEVFQEDINFMPLAEKVRDGFPDYGWTTTEVRKIEYAQAMCSEVRRQSVRFMRDLICANPFDSKPEKKKRIINELMAQLRRYAIRQNPST